MAAAPVSADTNGQWRKAKSSIHKLDEALRASLKSAPEPQRVIIRMKAGYEDALKNALEWHGDIVEREHLRIGAMTAVVHGEDLEALANDPAVESVSADAEVHVLGAPGPKRIKQGRAANAKVKDTRRTTRKKGAPREEVIGEQRRIQGIGPGQPTGKGVGVALIDSGIELSDDLQAKVSAFYDFTWRARGRGHTDPDENPVNYPYGAVPTRPYDDYGHGTVLASLIANSGKDNGEYQGVAPGAHLIGLKVLDEDGNGKTSDVIDALNFAVEFKGALDIDVINLSLGHPVFESAATDPLVLAVEHAVRHGIVVVVSAGNFGMDPKTHEVGYGGITSPGNAPSVVTVGAADTRKTARRDDDTVASFSSRGPTWIDGLAKPDVVGPGVGEVGRASSGGKLYQSYPQVLIDDVDHIDFKRFAKLSGTSMAAAVTSGVAALVLEANSGVSPNALKAVLEYTATPLADRDGPYDALTQGAGEVNGMGAITMARAIETTIPWGETWVTAQVEPATLFDGQVTPWAQTFIWGNYRVRGDALFVNSEAWEENIVWGTFGDAENIVWGTLADEEQADNIVWGNSYFNEWGENIVWGNTFERDGDNIVWGSFTRDEEDNIVWGNSFEWDENIVWGNSLFGVQLDEAGENIVWGNMSLWDGDGENIVWGNLDEDNIVWGSACGGDGCGDDNIVWGNAVLIGAVK